MYGKFAVSRNKHMESRCRHKVIEILTNFEKYRIEIKKASDSRGRKR